MHSSASRDEAPHLPLLRQQRRHALPDGARAAALGEAEHSIGAPARILLACTGVGGAEVLCISAAGLAAGVIILHAPGCSSEAEPSWAHMTAPIATAAAISSHSNPHPQPSPRITLAIARATSTVATRSPSHWHCISVVGTAHTCSRQHRVQAVTHHMLLTCAPHAQRMLSVFSPRAQHMPHMLLECNAPQRPSVLPALPEGAGWWMQAQGHAPEGGIAPLCVMRSPCPLIHICTP